MRLPSGLSRGLQIAAFEKEIEKEKERQETMNVLLESIATPSNYSCDFSLGNKTSYHVSSAVYPFLCIELELKTIR